MNTHSLRSPITKWLYSAALLCAAMLLSGCKNDPISEATLEKANGFSDVSGVTLKVGEPAADFTLADTNGKMTTLSDFRGKSNVMLIFYRGNWCPFCVGHLEDIQTLLPKLADYDTQLLAVSPDDIETSQEFAERFDAPYLFLADTELKLTDLYGIRRDEELPHPAVIIIDKEGKVAWFYVGENYRERPSSEQIETVLSRLFKG